MKKDAQKRRRGPGVKAAKAKLEAKLEAKLGPPDPLATWPVVSPESEKLRHHQVGHSGNFCLRRLNSLIQQAEQLVSRPVEEIGPILELVGPILELVEVEEGEPILELVEPILEPAAGEESPLSLVSRSALASPSLLPRRRSHRCQRSCSRLRLVSPDNSAGSILISHFRSSISKRSLSRLSLLRRGAGHLKLPPLPVLHRGLW